MVPINKTCTVHQSRFQRESGLMCTYSDGTEGSLFQYLEWLLLVHKRHVVYYMALPCACMYMQEHRSHKWSV